MKETTDNLKLIEEMIASAKGNIKEGSIFYLIWGWLVLLAAATNYILMHYSSYENPWIAWPILMTLGGVLSALIGMRKAKKQVVRTYPERAMKYLWLGFLISLLAVFSGSVQIGIEGTYPVIMILYGLGTFVSGGILKFNPLKIGAVVSWVCGTVAFYVDFSDQLLLIMLAIIASYIIPGHLLANSKEQYV